MIVGLEYCLVRGLLVRYAFGVLDPESGVLVRLRGRGVGACGAGRFGRSLKVGLSFPPHPSSGSSSDGAESGLAVRVRSLRLPAWGWRDMRYAT